MPEELTPLPCPFDLCYEWSGAFGVKRKFFPELHNGQGPDRSVTLFTADQMRAYARENRRAQPEPAAPARAQDRSHAGIEWSVSKDGLRIESDYFHFDAVLKLSGDFTDEQERKQYADSLAAKLNAPDAAPSVAMNDRGKASDAPIDDAMKRALMKSVKFIDAAPSVAPEPAPVAYKVWHREAKHCFCLASELPTEFRSDTGEPDGYFGGKVQPLFAHPPREASVAPEPVAWIPADGGSTFVTTNERAASPDYLEHYTVPLYLAAHPPRAPLTEGALMGIYMEFDRHADKAWTPTEYLLRFAAAVDAHGIRGQG